MAHTAGPPPAARLPPVRGGPAAWAVLTVGQFAAVVAVLQRSSLGVAATDALTRFGITAATLATFSMLPLHRHDVRGHVGLSVPDGGSGALAMGGRGADAGAVAVRAVLRRDAGQRAGPLPVLPQPHRDRCRRRRDGGLGGCPAVARTGADVAARDARRT